MTPSNGARMTVNDRSRSALSRRRLQLVERARGLLLLRLEHGDVGVGGFDRGLGAEHRGARLIAVRLRLLELLLAGEYCCWASCCWRFNSRSARVALACAEATCAFACATAACWAVTCLPMRAMRRRLRRDVGARGIDGDAIVAIVDAWRRHRRREPWCCRRPSPRRRSPAPSPPASRCGRRHRRRRSRRGSGP